MGLNITKEEFREHIKGHEVVSVHYEAEDEESQCAIILDNGKAMLIRVSVYDDGKMIISTMEDKDVPILSHLW